MRAEPDLEARRRLKVGRNVERLLIYSFEKDEHPESEDVWNEISQTFGTTGSPTINNLQYLIFSLTHLLADGGGIDMVMDVVGVEKTVSFESVTF